MGSKPSYPNWYCTFRGLVMGIGLGCAVTTIAYESKLIIPGGAIWGYLIFPLLINLLPWLVLASFEAHFAIQRYRALRRGSEPAP
jgi:hypothetical protein